MPHGKENQTTKGTVASQNNYSLDPLVESYAVNERMNQMILENLNPRAWRAKPPGRNPRTIAAIFSHVHNIRCKWIRLSAPHLKLPANLDRSTCTPAQTRKALAVSADQCSKMLSEMFSVPEGKAEAHIQKFHRDGWVHPWPAGPSAIAYMLTHDAHHRGQVCMLAHQLGFPLPPKIAYKLWGWEKLWKQCGFSHPR